ncbi:unnamed protein product [Cylicostephanus goldi]|uniref:Uncharacterized protein n=1 Tax=Cylicostephanus goldi TaxID=71465 RepID=A0A3P6TB63_CYLGO|nr:unnamed protein product [Cylicostephanus goldi]
MGNIHLLSTVRADRSYKWLSVVDHLPKPLGITPCLRPIIPITSFSIGINEASDLSGLFKDGDIQLYKAHERIRALTKELAMQEDAAVRVSGKTSLYVCHSKPAMIYDIAQEIGCDCHHF